MKAVVSADTVSVEKRPLYYHLMRSNSLISDYSNWRDSLTAFKQGYEIIGGSEHAETFYRSFLPYCINSLIFWYNRFTAMNNKLRKDFIGKCVSFSVLLTNGMTSAALKTRNWTNLNALSAAAGCGSGRENCFPACSAWKRGAAQNRHCLRNQNQNENN